MKFLKKRLNEVCLLITDGKHGDCVNQENSGYYFISAKDVRNWTINYEGAREITQEDYDDTHRRTKFEPFDVVVVSTGANIGDIAIGKDIEKTYKTTFQKSVAILKSDKGKLSPFYLAYFLKSSRETLHNISSGSAQKNVLLKDLRQLEIPIPPLPTQGKIASILSAYDDLIENNLKRIKLLEEKAFLRYKGIVRSEKLEKKILSDFGEIITGKTPPTTNKDFFGNDIPFIKIPDMHSQIFIEHTEQSLSELGAKYQEKKFLPALSLCVSCIGTAGIVGITSKPSQTNQQINAIVFEEKRNTYFFYSMMSQMKEQLDALGSSGSTFTNVNKNKFENMEVFIPNQRVLNEFADEFEAPFKLILTLQKQNSKLREARDILLPKLMSGEIEV